MGQRVLGKTGRDVSIVGLGTWQLGADWGSVTESDALAVLRAAASSGVTFFDTADVYGDGRSEAIMDMRGIITLAGATTDATLQGIEQAVAGGEFFWLNLDIHDPGPDDDVTGLLVNTFHFHPVAVEAVEQFGQRPAGAHR